MEQHTLSEFWDVYDAYIAQHDRTLIPALIDHLAQIADIESLTRPEMQWNRILAWEVLRRHKETYVEDPPFHLYPHEIILVEPVLHSQVFINRFPELELFEKDRIVMKGKSVFLPLYDKGTLTAKVVAFYVEQMSGRLLYIKNHHQAHGMPHE